MLASAPPEHYRQAEKILLADDAIDSLLVIFIPPIASNADEVASAIVDGRARRPQAGPRDLHERQGSAARPRADPVLSLPRVGGHRARRGPRPTGNGSASPPARSRSSPASTRPRARAVVERALERGGGWLAPARDRGVPVVLRDPRRPHAAGADGRRGGGRGARARIPRRAEGRRPDDPPQDRGRRRPSQPRRRGRRPRRLPRSEEASRRRPHGLPRPVDGARAASR